MFVFIPGFIPPVRFGPAGTDPTEISIPAVTYIYLSLEKANWPDQTAIKCLPWTNVRRTKARPPRSQWKN